VSPIKPVVPGGIAPTPVSPVKPLTPSAAATPVAPVPAGIAPMKPSASVTSPPREVSQKSGTSIVKSAPPKETARITVKPNLPSPVRTAANLPTVKAPGAVAAPTPAKPVVNETKPVTAPAAVSKTAVFVPKPVATAPATTPAGATAVAATPAKPGAKPAVAVAPVAFPEENTGSTLWTTIAAGALAVLTWGTAGILFASYMAWM
jgi:hypothetical protein